MLCLVKLGGSLITDKHTPRTPRTDVIESLASEIAAARAENSDLQLVIGHGSGSFGHRAAVKHGTRAGVSSAKDWIGFAEVWHEARALNQIVIEAFHHAGVPGVAFPPSAIALAADGRLLEIQIRPLQAALQAGLVPLTNGDTVFDTERGGTILSTEDIFVHLAERMRPQRILLAGSEAGVWEDFPGCTRLVERITPRNFHQLKLHIHGSAAVDVTGGMNQKVQLMLNLVVRDVIQQAVIFSGEQPGNLTAALRGEKIGTTIEKGTGEHE